MIGPSAIISGCDWLDWVFECVGQGGSRPQLIGAVKQTKIGGGARVKDGARTGYDGCEKEGGVHKLMCGAPCAARAFRRIQKRIEREILSFYALFYEHAWLTSKWAFRVARFRDGGGRALCFDPLF